MKQTVKEAAQAVIDAYGCECIDKTKPGHCPMCSLRSAIKENEENQLTDEEKNLIKDLIKLVSENKIIEKYFQDNFKYQNKDLYNCLMDSIFNKLQNGRLTVNIN